MLPDVVVGVVAFVFGLAVFEIVGGTVAVFASFDACVLGRTPLVLRFLLVLLLWVVLLFDRLFVSFVFFVFVCCVCLFVCSLASVNVFV